MTSFCIFMIINGVIGGSSTAL